jgi:RNA polymerase sigma-70 factor (ECF subfamily)
MAAVRAVVVDEESSAPLTPDDGVLVARVKRGDVGAYDVLVRRYLRRASVIARRLLGNADDAEDLVQDAFVRALERLHTFDDNRDFAPWFFRLLINTGLNARKARARRTMEPEPPDLPSPADGPLQLLERLEVRERFTAALDALSPRQRLIVSMFEVDGLTTAEIADALGITPETVRWHHHQARRVLRAALAALRS